MITAFSIIDHIDHIDHIQKYGSSSKIAQLPNVAP